MVRPLHSKSTNVCWKLGKKLAAYSTAGVAAALLADTADADVIPYSPPGGSLVLPSGNGVATNEIFVDLNDDALNDYRLYSYLGFTIVSTNNPGADINRVLWSLQYFAALVLPGETIGPLSGDFEQFGFMDLFIGARGYVGLKFDIPGGSPHYGYLDIGIDSAAETLTVYGGAYESLANTAITVPLPEPSAWGLLAMGAVGLAAWRLRKSGEHST